MLEGGTHDAMMQRGLYSPCGPYPTWSSERRMHPFLQQPSSIVVEGSVVVEGDVCFVHMGQADKKVNNRVLMHSCSRVNTRILEGPQGYRACKEKAQAIMFCKLLSSLQFVTEMG